MKPLNVSSRDLEAALAVARSSSFRAAAAELGLTQPSVSARVRHLEDVLGVRLFNRTTRRVSLTPHGERLVVRADQALADLRSLVQEFKEESLFHQSSLTIATTLALSGSFLPAVIQRFRQRWPAIEVVLHTAYLSDTLESLARADVDLAVTPWISKDSRFECEALAEDEFVVVARSKHPLVKTGVVKLADVAKHAVLTMPAGTFTRELLANAYLAAGLSFKPAFEAESLVSLLAMVKEGLGIAFISERVLPLFNMEGLKITRLQDVELRRTIALTLRRGHPPRPAAKLMIDALRSGALAQQR